MIKLTVCMQCAGFCLWLFFYLSLTKKYSDFAENLLYHQKTRPDAIQNDIFETSRLNLCLWPYLTIPESFTFIISSLFGELSKKMIIWQRHIAPLKFNFITQVWYLNNYKKILFTGAFLETQTSYFFLINYLSFLLWCTFLCI